MACEHDLTETAEMAVAMLKRYLAWHERLVDWAEHAGGLTPSTYDEHVCLYDIRELIALGPTSSPNDWPTP